MVREPIQSQDRSGPVDARPSALGDGRDDLAELVARIAGGDPAALNGLYDRTCAAVYGTVHRLVPDSQTAEEVTLDVYHQVWRQADRFDVARGRPVAWLQMIARTRAIDRRRSDAARGHAEVDLPDWDATAVCERAPEGSGIEAEERARVRAAVDTLPDRQREALVMAFSGGLTHREIADRLSLPLGTVKTRIRLALHKLRTILRPFEESNACDGKI